MINAHKNIRDMKYVVNLSSCRIKFGNACKIRKEFHTIK